VNLEVHWPCSQSESLQSLKDLWAKATFVNLSGILHELVENTLFHLHIEGDMIPSSLGFHYRRVFVFVCVHFVVVYPVEWGYPFVRDPYLVDLH
jgi:hypothetical protein